MKEEINMVSYGVKYFVKNNPSITYRENIDAKNLKSAKHKIESRLAKKENKKRVPSKQIKVVRIEIVDYSINGYY